MPGACPKPGTAMVLSVNATVTSLSADGLKCNLHSSISGDFTFIGLLLRVDKRVAPTPEAIAAITRLWPLEAGKSARVIRHGDTSDLLWEDAYTVGPKQQVVTKAGTFQAFPIVVEETFLSTSPQAFDGIYTTYISPELGYGVKFTFRIGRGDPHRAPPDWELVSVQSP